jgi:hypothetical protein
MSRGPAEAIDPELRRRLAADCFNKTWTLLDKGDRTPEDDDEMLHCAHASRHHWGEIGTAAHRARGEWQCSRVYAVLGRAEPALFHAQRCLGICEANPSEIEDWDLPFAYEALARAHAVAGNAAESARCLEQARSRGAAIVEDEERELLESDLATIGT